MRILEIALLLILLASLACFLLPGSKKPGWTNWLPGLAIVIDILHLLLEKYRWQMVPAYGLALLFLLLSLIGIKPSRKNAQPYKGFFLFIVFGVFLFLPISIALPVLVPVFHLPGPTGLYAVGTTYLDLVDETRPEAFTPDEGDFRELSVQVWYPARPVPGTAPAPYFRNIAAVRPVIADLAEQQHLPLPSFGLNHLTLVKTHSYLDVPVAEASSPFPTLIFSHGYMAWNGQNTAQMEELASHGYVIFSISHTYESLITSFTDGRSVPVDSRVLNTFFRSQSLLDPYTSRKTWVADTLFMMDVLQELNSGKRASIFAGKLDLDRLGIFGHSFGGWTAAQVCTVDDRCKAGISLDGGFTVPYPRGPFMYMFRDEWDSQDILPSLYANRPTYVIAIQGSKHLNFGDFSLYSPLLKLSDSDLWGLGPINGQRMVRLLSIHVLEFFDKYLKGMPASSLDGPAPDFPEVRVLWPAP